MKRNNNGFSLIEISIVLSIVGILMGFTMKGRELMETAKIKSVISQIENYRSSVQIFIDKYAGIPGDITDAVSAFGGENGHMSGSIDSVEDVKRFWAHLIKSGLISASLINGLPTTKLGGMLFVRMFEGGYWIVLCGNGSTHESYKGILSEQIARRIEKTMDNGDINSGDVRGIKDGSSYVLMFRIS